MRFLKTKNALLEIGFYFPFGMITIYTLLYLRAHGFEPFQVGLIFTVGNALSALLQTQTGPRTAGPEAIPLRRMLFLHTVPLLIFTLPLFLPNLPKILLAIFFTILILFAQAVQGPLNSVIFSFASAGYPIYFNRMRSIGSVAYGVVSLFLGIFFEATSVNTYPYFLLASLVLFNFAVWWMPEPPKPKQEILSKDFEDVTGQPLPDAEALPKQPAKKGGVYRKYPIFIPLVIGFTLLFMTYIVINTYMAILVESLHGTSSSIGIAIAIAVVGEVIGIFSYYKLRTHFADWKLLTLSAVVFTVKTGLLLLGNNITILYLSQVLHIGAFALFTAGFSYFANDIVDPEDLSSGQTVAITIMSLGGAIGNFLGGLALQLISVKQTFLLLTILGLIGTTIVVVTMLRQFAGKSEISYSNK